MPRSGARRSYKEIQLQQLRSFYETARLGSLTAAAESLGLAQPTVWEQVHALEHALAVTLVERHARGFRLTDSGRVVAELAAPLVQGLAAFKRNVQEKLGREESRVTIATTQRILVEDLPNAILAFEQNHPQVHVCLLELRIEQVPQAVESGDADLGLTTEQGTDHRNLWLLFEPAYELELYLVTPKDHPLARRRRIRPHDLLGYPLVNAPQGFPDPILASVLEKSGAFRSQPRRVEAYYTAVIRRYVELGFGIGLIVGLPGHVPPDTLHERPMSRFFGRVNVNLVLRKGEAPGSPVREFGRTIRTLLKRRRARKQD
jgi:molybdate transport repressor ModE-like protein